MDKIDTSYYLVLTYNGNRRLSTRTCKTKPNLGHNEIAIKCKLSLPVSLFLKPQLAATLSIDKELEPQTVSLKTICDIKKAVLQSSGVDLNIKFIDEKK